MPHQPADAINHAELRAKARRENFPVAMRVLPQRYRRDLSAVYAVLRTIDDLGDEATGDRAARLDAFAVDLQRIWLGGTPHAVVLRQLVPTVLARGLTIRPFLDLVEANRIDQRITSYATFEDLLAYCRLSARPVGRLVLAIFDASTPDRVDLSDRICDALQLLEHWQDVAEDRRAGRVYLPQEDLRRYGVVESELDSAMSSPRVRRLILHQTARAEALLNSGAPLVARLRGWAQLAVAGYVAGGQATVDAIRRGAGDVLRTSPRPRRSDTARHLLSLLAHGRSVT